MSSYSSSEHVDPGDSGIRISGKVEPATSLQGPLLIEIVRDEQQDTSLYSVVCGVSESFEFFAPPDLENVYVVAFSDSDGNGPSEADPMGISPKISIVDGEIVLEPIQMAGSIQPLSLPFVMMDVAEPSQEVQQPMDGEMPSGEEEDLPPPVNRPLDEDLISQLTHRPQNLRLNPRMVPTELRKERQSEPIRKDLWTVLGCWERRTASSDRFSCVRG